MVKVLIVDDDSIERRALKNFINWESINVEIVGEAWNGEHGIEAAVSLKPNIIIADVRMPVMDGIEMASRIRDVLPQTKIILCSAYEEFEYAKRAINLNLFGYVIKPINEEELLNMVNKAAQKCLKDSMKDQIYSKMKSNYSSNLYLVKKAICFDLLMGISSYDPEILDNSHLGWLTTKDCNLGILHLQCQDHISEKILKDIEMVLLKRNKQLVVLSIPINQIVILVNLMYDSEPSDKMEELKNSILSVDINLHNAVKSAKYTYGIQDYISLAQNFEKLLTKSQGQLGNVIEIKTKIEQTNILNDNTVAPKDNNCYQAMLGLIVDAVKQKNTTFLEKELDSFFSIFVKDYKEVGSELFKFAIQLITNLYQLISETNLASFQNINDVLVFLIDVPNIKSTNEIHNKIYDYLVKIVVRSENYVNIELKNTDNIVKYIENIIAKNYHKHITVEEIAKLMHFSSNYIGSIYKIIKKVSINEYVAKYRVAKAIELMCTSDLSISNIAGMCGFDNIPYFHSTFKKHIGVTASFYRRLIYSKNAISTNKGE